jgi:hypothetical protein
VNTHVIVATREQEIHLALTYAKVAQGDALEPAGNMRLSC